jgi:tetratricopeptide (TPR) repeat protein
MSLFLQRAFALFVIVLAASGAQASDVYFEAHSLDDALSLARANRTLVVIDFWNVNCPPCRSFAKHVTENAAVKTALEGLVLFKAELPALEKLGKEYNVFLFPTYVMLNADGELLATWIGYPGPDHWAAIVDEVVADPVTTAQRKARFERTPDFKDAFRLAHVEYTQKRFEPASQYLQRASSLDPQASKDAGVPLDLFRVAYHGVRAGDITIDQCMGAIAGVLTADDVDQEDALFVADKMLGAKKYVDPDTMVQVLKMVNSALPKNTEADEYGRLETFRIEYAYLVENDAAKAVELKRSSLTEGWESNYKRLNGFAWWCFQHETNLEEAEALTLRAIDLSPDAAGKANCLDTLAELVNLRGDTDEAIALMKQAIELDPHGSYSAYYKRQLEKFEGLRESARK